MGKINKIKAIRISSIVLPGVVGYISSWLFKFPLEYAAIAIYVMGYAFGLLDGSNLDKIIQQRKEEKEKKRSYRTWVVLMAFRCKYIGQTEGKEILTLKGYRYIPIPILWRSYSMLLTFVSKKYRETMLSVLESVERYKNPFIVSLTQNS